MPLTGFFLRNSRISLIAFAFMLASGIRAFLSIPLSEDPPIEIPRYDVVAIAPGMNPAELEKHVVQPLEETLKTLEGVKRTTALVRDGVAQMSVEFEFGSDTDAKYNDVQREVSATRQLLPPTLARLEVLRGRTTDVAIMQIAVVSPDRSVSSLGETADALQKRIARVSGVRRVQTHAVPKREVHVTLDETALARGKVGLSQVTRALQAANSEIPGGSVVVGSHEMSIATSAGATDLEGLRHLPLGPNTNPGDVVRLGDVAQVDWSQENDEVFGRFNGQRAVFLSVTMQEGRNIHDVTAGIKAVLEDFRKPLPADTRLEIGFDQSRNVEHRMTRLERDFTLALLLVLVTLAPLGFRPALIVMLSIPLCLALGLAALQWAGFGLNQLSMVGCVIALGLLVDDSIVVVENIVRFRREGHGAADAARLATRQISAAVVGTTATLLFAFLPLLMLPEAAGLFIRSLPAAVVFAITASLFVALTIVPWLASILLRSGGNHEANRALRILQRGISGIYLPILKWCMAHRAAALLAAAALCLGSFAFVPAIGFSLFPKADTPHFLIEISAEAGASTQVTDKIVTQIENWLAEEPMVESACTLIGEGNPRVYYNVFPTGRRVGTASILVSLHSYDMVRTPALIGRLRNLAAKIPGARIRFREFQNGPPLVAPIEVRVFGSDLDELSRAAANVEKAVQTTGGTCEVMNPAEERRLEVTAQLDETFLASQRIDRQSAQQLVRLVFAGLEAGHLGAGTETLIRLRLPEERRTSLDDWGAVMVPVAPGQNLPLRQFAKLESTSQRALIERRDGEHVVTITAQVAEGQNAERVTEAVRHQLQKLLLPPDCRWEFGGELEGRQESFAGFGNAILLAVFGILAVLVLEFKSFRGMLVVASVIPLGIVGGLLGLWLTGYTLSFMAMIGFIALIGIEIKNSILLVDCTNKLRAKGMPLEAAIAQAGEIRFLPVVLTTMTALGALAPLALQHSPLYSPLAVVIMGGSLSSLLLSRLVTPVLYRMLPPKARPESIKEF
jgi:multidrug efflux pump subunit AcrB